MSMIKKLKKKLACRMEQEFILKKYYLFSTSEVFYMTVEERDWYIKRIYDQTYPRK